MRGAGAMLTPSQAGAHMLRVFLLPGLAIVRAREADVARTGKENPNEGKFVKALLQLHESCKQVQQAPPPSLPTPAPSRL